MDCLLNTIKRLIYRHELEMLALAVLLPVLYSCSGKKQERIDQLNGQSYAWHYRNLDSAEVYARWALKEADNKGDGAAEAYNNLAFVDIARMKYRNAWRLLKQVPELTDNQIEILISDVQLMRLCQRESFNKEFYDYHERALRCIQRFQKESYRLSDHQQRRLLYAQSEFQIVTSTYYYYVGLNHQAAQAIQDMSSWNQLIQDTAQYINYCYNVGAGGIILGGTKQDIAQSEFEYLIQAYVLAQRCDMPFWEAQIIQAISEHIQDPSMRKLLISNNVPAFKYINTYDMPDSLLAGNLALRALQIFTEYGDVYQVAGANRTLAECYWYIHDYRSALICLQRALAIKAVHQAPDLVASIRERLSLVYSAVDDKANSDRNRNIYLDIQERSRQDRQLEARASQLNYSSRQLNIMLVAVVLMILVFVALLFVFDAKRRRSDKAFSLDTLLEPLRNWQRENEKRNRLMNENINEMKEQLTIGKLHLQQHKRKNLDARAKVQLVNSILPFIDRMVYVVHQLKQEKESHQEKRDADWKKRNYDYLMEITDSINDYNSILTQWIQMRQGDVSLKIESFDLQDLFDMVERSRASFRIKGIDLQVKPTDLKVKADKTLTLFMINTIADNARKFSKEGGVVKVEANGMPDYVEISILDNGPGMTKEKLSHIFDRTYTGGHGFGLKNCNGIIEKYKKMSRIFSVASIGAESELGKGTRVFFRLPYGFRRALTVLLLLFATILPALSVPSVPRRGYANESQAAAYADSTYYCNIRGEYERALRFADSCRAVLSPSDTVILLDVSNETAVAALALHQWKLYEKSNSVYTSLFRQASADSSLPDYVRTMQRSENNKTVAIILLVLLLLTILPAYYFLYYRHQLDYQSCIDRIRKMNQLLTSDLSDEQKLKGIDRLADFASFDLREEQLATLSNIVQTVRQAELDAIQGQLRQADDLEFAEDEQRRLNLETARLHVSNSVLDNCLSAFKHETMYYPSRIRQLVQESPDSIDDIAEVVDYYHDLYVVLAQQAMRQVPTIRLDDEMVDYFFDLLGDVNDRKAPAVMSKTLDDGYLKMQCLLSQRHDDAEACRALFTPYTSDLRFLLCRQIVREMGEATNQRACGLSAHVGKEGILIEVIMPARLNERCLIAMKNNHIQI